MCLCAYVFWAKAELFKGFNLQWISAVNNVIPVISAISGKTSVRKTPFCRVLTEKTHGRKRRKGRKGRGGYAPPEL